MMHPAHFLNLIKGNTMLKPMGAIGLLLITSALVAPSIAIAQTSPDTPETEAAASEQTASEAAVSETVP